MEDHQIETISKLIKSISHPIRIKILCLLEEQEISVGDLLEGVSTSSANLSQHLSILRGEGVITCRKDASYIYHRIADRRIVELLKDMNLLFFSDI